MGTLFIGVDMQVFSPNIGQIGIQIQQTRITFFEKILAVLDGKMPEPTMFGWYHWLCLFATLGLCVLVCLKARNLSDKRFNLILGLTSALLITLEIYKQLNHAYDWENDTWAYNWRVFPFQFCSTPMYVMLAAVLIKNQKIREALYCFLGTYGLFAGTAVMLYPTTVFTETIGINLQTMIHHGAMVVIGIMMYTSGKVPLTHKSVLRGVPVFVILVTLALIANILYGEFGDPEGTFNMFFISPYYPCELPVFDSLYRSIPYPLFLAAYILGFSVAAYLMLLLAMLGAKIELKLKNAKRYQ